MFNVAVANPNNNNQNDLSNINLNAPIRHISFDTYNVNVEHKKNKTLKFAFMEYAKNIDSIKQQMNDAKTLSQLIPIANGSIGQRSYWTWGSSYQNATTVMNTNQGANILKWGTTEQVNIKKELNDVKNILLQDLETYKPGNIFFPDDVESDTTPEAPQEELTEKEKRINYLRSISNLYIEKEPRKYLTKINSELNPDSEVNFICGGGLMYLLEFMRGNREGYRLENKVKVFDSDEFIRPHGIQVHPFTENLNNITEDTLYDNNNLEFVLNRSINHYSENSIKCLDLPAYLTGRIKAKYLDAAPNAYEGGIRNIYINKIEDLKFYVNNLFDFRITPEMDPENAEFSNNNAPKGAAGRSNKKPMNDLYYWAYFNLGQSFVVQMAKLNNNKSFDAMDLAVGIKPKNIIDYSTNNGMLRAL